MESDSGRERGCKSTDECEGEGEGESAGLCTPVEPVDDPGPGSAFAAAVPPPAHAKAQPDLPSFAM